MPCVKYEFIKDAPGVKVDSLKILFAPANAVAVNSPIARLMYCKSNLNILNFCKLFSIETFNVI